MSLKRLLLGALVFVPLAVAAESTQSQSSSASATKTQDKSSTSTSATGSSTTTAATSSVSSGDPQTSSTASRTQTGPVTWTVTVGAPLGTFAFSPDTIENAEKGDTVLFEFFPANHSVVKMDPSTPCIPFEDTNPGGASFYSGFQPTDITALESHNSPTWSLPINDSNTVWFYCSAPDSCIPHGMVGVINPPNNTILGTVQAHAKQQSYALSPGQSVPNEDGSNPSATSTPSSGKSSGLSGGAIAGIVIGAVAAFALIGLLFFFVGRRKKAKEMKSVPSTGVDPYSDNGGVAAAGMQSPHMQQFHPEHPPVYQQDPRYSYVPPGSPGWPAADAAKRGHLGHLSQQSAVSSPDAMDQNPNRLSELASQNYDPVEMYTPGLPTSVENPNSPDVGMGQHTAEQKFEQHQRMMHDPSST